MAPRFQSWFTPKTTEKSHWNKDLHTNVHSTTIHNSQSVHGLMNEYTKRTPIGSILWKVLSNTLVISDVLLMGHMRA